MLAGLIALFYLGHYRELGPVPANCLWAHLFVAFSGGFYFASFSYFYEI